MVPLTDREDAAINALNVVLGIILIVSPWAVGFAAAELPSWNAVISGAVIAIVAFAAFVRLRAWEEWISLVVGLWVLASPWLLGFAGLSSAFWTHLTVGLMVVALAAIDLSRMGRSPPAGNT